MITDKWPRAAYTVICPLVTGWYTAAKHGGWYINVSIQSWIQGWYHAGNGQAQRRVRASWYSGANGQNRLCIHVTGKKMIMDKCAAKTGGLIWNWYKTNEHKRNFKIMGKWYQAGKGHLRYSKRTSATELIMDKKVMRLFLLRIVWRVSHGWLISQWYGIINTLSHCYTILNKNMLITVLYLYCFSTVPVLYQQNTNFVSEKLSKQC